MAKVLLFCHDSLSSSMAGPAIRYWEFANSLSQNHGHQVTLLSIHPTELKSSFFKILSYGQISLEELVKNHDVIVCQLLPLRLAYFVKRYKKQVILDSYDPLPIESLEFYKDSPSAVKNKFHRKLLNNARFSFLLSDKIICACPSQRDLWTGFMCSMGLITPEVYEKDALLNKKIGIVPFGLNSTSPQKNGPGLRELFQLPPSDFVVIWGGGMWNWFDPLTAIKALHHISQFRTDIKLVFMGTKHPHPGMPEMKMTKDAIELALSLKLLNRHVFFNFGWVPYNQRQNYLLDAQVGISCHFDNLETRFSFRTRILDYLWAELPILTTKGDFFADLVKEKELGKVVSAENYHELAEAIIELATLPELRKKYQKNIAKVKNDFSWSTVTSVLDTYIKDMADDKKTPSGIKPYAILCQYFCQTVANKGIRKSLMEIFKQIRK